MFVYHKFILTLFLWLTTCQFSCYATASIALRMCFLPGPRICRELTYCHKTDMSDNYKVTFNSTSSIDTIIYYGKHSHISTSDFFYSELCSDVVE